MNWLKRLFRVDTNKEREEMPLHNPTLNVAKMLDNQEWRAWEKGYFNPKWRHIKGGDKDED